MKLPWTLTENIVLKSVIIFLNTLPLVGYVVFIVPLLWWAIKQEPGSEYAGLLLTAATIAVAIILILVNSIIYIGFLTFKKGRLPSLLYVIGLLCLLFGGTYAAKSYIERSENQKNDIQITYSAAADLVSACQLDSIFLENSGLLSRQKQIYVISYERDIYNVLRGEKGLLEKQYKSLVELAKTNRQCGDVEILEDSIQINRPNNRLLQ